MGLCRILILPNVLLPMPADVTRYRLRDTTTGAIVATGAEALAVPFALRPDGLPKYSLHWEVSSEAPRPISDEARYRGRRRRLRKRLDKQFPLFADDMERKELAARPAYYGIDS